MLNYERAAFAEIKLKRAAAEQKADNAKLELRKDFEYSRLENERDTLAFEIGRLSSQNKDLGNLKSQFESVNARLAERLASLGYTDKDITPQYSCTICKDTGMQGVQNCTCVKVLIFSLLKANSGASVTDIDDFSKVSFQAFDADVRAAHKKTYLWLKRYSDAFPDNPYKIIFFTGAVGTGKTFAVTVLANNLNAKGFSSYILGAQGLNSLFLRYHLAPIENKESIFRPLIEADFLVIDDLGAEQLYNNVTENYLYMLLTERFGKPTAFTTNHNTAQLEDKYGQRIFSRITDKSRCVYLNFMGRDLRNK
ncbi:MAG: ATP-binding protein [Clostridia bacterium]